MADRRGAEPSAAGASAAASRSSASGSPAASTPASAAANASAPAVAAPAATAPAPADGKAAPVSASRAPARASPAASAPKSSASSPQKTKARPSSKTHEPPRGGAAAVAHTAQGGQKRYVVYGPLIYDRATKKIKGLHVPVVLDLLTDRVRSRVLSSAIFLTIFAVIAYTLLYPALRDPSFASLDKDGPVASVSVVVGMPRQVSLSSSPVGRPPVVRVTNRFGDALEGRTVTARVWTDRVPTGEFSHETSTNTLSTSWDRAADAVLYEALVSAATAVTDSDGLAVFSRFAVVTGLPGPYHVQFVSEGVVSDTTESFEATTDVTKVEWIWPEPSFRARLFTYRVPLDDVVRLRVLDGNNTAVEGVVCTLSSADNTFFDSKQSLKLSTISGFHSDPSDADGICSFPHLFYTGSNWPDTFVLAFANGVKVFSGPHHVRLDTTVGSVTLTTPLPAEIEEFVPLADVVEVVVRDPYGVAAPGRIVFAMISTTMGFDLPPDSLWNSGPAVKGFTQVYSSMSDADGVARFDNLAFDGAGYASIAEDGADGYRIMFMCEGVQSVPSSLIAVRTSVAKVQVHGAPFVATVGADNHAPRVKALGHEGDFTSSTKYWQSHNPLAQVRGASSSSAKPQVTALNARGDGVMHKAVVLEIVGDDRCALQDVGTPSPLAQDYTGTDGAVTVEAFVARASKSGVYRVRARVDDVYSDPFNLTVAVVRVPPSTIPGSVPIDTGDLDTGGLDAGGIDTGGLDTGGLDTGGLDTGGLPDVPGVPGGVLADLLAPPMCATVEVLDPVPVAPPFGEVFSPRVRVIDVFGEPVANATLFPGSTMGFDSGVVVLAHLTVGAEGEDEAPVQTDADGYAQPRFRIDYSDRVTLLFSVIATFADPLGASDDPATDLPYRLGCTSKTTFMKSYNRAGFVEMDTFPARNMSLIQTGSIGLNCILETGCEKTVRVRVLDLNHSPIAGVRPAVFTASSPSSLSWPYLVDELLRPAEFVLQPPVVPAFNFSGPNSCDPFYPVSVSIVPEYLVQCLMPPTDSNGFSEVALNFNQPGRYVVTAMSEGLMSTSPVLYTEASLATPQTLTLTTPPTTSRSGNHNECTYLGKMGLPDDPAAFPVPGAGVDGSTGFVNKSVCASVATAFPGQPAVTLTRADGSPVSGKIVGAYVAIIEPFYGLHSGRVFQLGGMASMPTDENGVARWDNLGVIAGSGCYGLNFVAYLDGNDFTHAAIAQNYVPLVAHFQGITLTPEQVEQYAPEAADWVVCVYNPVSQVAVRVAPPAVGVTVGTPMTPPAAVQLLDERGRAVPNVEVDAIILSTPSGSPAVLANSRRKTDISGYAFFPDLMFVPASADKPATFGAYKIGFRALGITSVDVDLLSVAETANLTQAQQAAQQGSATPPDLGNRVVILTGTPSVLTPSAVPLFEHRHSPRPVGLVVGNRASLPTTVYAGSAARMPVSNVVITATIAKSPGNAKLDPCCNQATTNERGLASFHLKLAAGKPGEYRITFTAAGVITATTLPFPVVNDIAQVSLMDHPAPNAVLEVDMAGSFVVRVTDADGASVPGESVDARAVESDARLSYPMPSLNGTAAVTDNDGRVVFSNVRFVAGSTGVKHIVFTVRGVESSHWGVSLYNPNEPDLSGLSKWSTELYTWAGLSIPFFMANSARQSRGLIFVALGFSGYVLFRLVGIASLSLAHGGSGLASQAFILLAITVAAMAAIPIGFLYLLFGLIRGSTTGEYSEGRNKACHTYVKGMLGSRQYRESAGTVVRRPIMNWGTTNPLASVLGGGGGGSGGDDGGGGGEKGALDHASSGRLKTGAGAVIAGAGQTVVGAGKTAIQMGGTAVLGAGHAVAGAGKTLSSGAIKSVRGAATLKTRAAWWARRLMSAVRNTNFEEDEREREAILLREAMLHPPEAPPGPYFMSQRVLFALLVSIYGALVLAIATTLAVKTLEVRLTDLRNELQSEVTKWDARVSTLETAANAAQQAADLTKSLVPPGASSAESSALSSFTSQVPGASSFDTSALPNVPDGTDAISYLVAAKAMLALPLPIWNSVQDSIVTAGYISGWLTFFCVLIIWVFIVRLYKLRIMRMRRGQYHFDRRLFHLHKAAAYIGLQAAHIVVGFLLLWVLLWGLMFIIVDKGVRDAVGEKLGAAVFGLLVSTTLISVLTQKFAQYVLVRNKFVWHFRVFTLYDLGMIFVTLAAGLVTAVTRLITMIAFLIVQFIRLDLTTLAEPLQPLDPGYHSYIAALVSDTYYSNPIMVVFTDSLVRFYKRARAKAKDEFLSDYVESHRGVEGGETALRLTQIAHIATTKSHVGRMLASGSSSAQRGDDGEGGVAMVDMGESKDNPAGAAAALRRAAKPRGKFLSTKIHSPKTPSRVIRNRWQLYWMLHQCKWLRAMRGHAIEAERQRRHEAREKAKAKKAKPSGAAARDDGGGGGGGGGGRGRGASGGSTGSGGGQSVRRRFGDGAADAPRRRSGSASAAARASARSRPSRVARVRRDSGDQDSALLS